MSKAWAWRRNGVAVATPSRCAFSLCNPQLLIARDAA
jgi:hypothetical protein